MTGVDRAEGARVGVAIPAAGSGARMGGQKKPLLELAGEPVLAHALRPFLADARTVAIRVALHPDEASRPPSWILALDPRLAVVLGGASRAESVARAVGALPTDLDVILIHDAARPLVTADVVDRVIRAALAGQGAVAGWPATDTLKKVDDELKVIETPDRRRLWHAQTPQGFPAALIREALADEERRAGSTDDAALVEAVGGSVVMVEGSPWNLKVTRPEDLEVAELMLNLRPVSAP